MNPPPQDQPHAQLDDGLRREQEWVDRLDPASEEGKVRDEARAEYGHLDRQEDLASHAASFLVCLKWPKPNDPPWMREANAYWRRRLKALGVSLGSWKRMLARVAKRGFEAVWRGIHRQKCALPTQAGHIAGVARHRRRRREQRAARPAVRPVRRVLAATRTAPRRVGIRRHRRPATRATAASSDDGSPPAPPHPTIEPIAACALVALVLVVMLAGYYLGSRVALLLPALVGTVLFTEQEVAAKLKCSVPLVRKLRARGLLAWVRVGKSPRITQGQLDAYIDAQTRAARGPVRVVRGAR